MILTNIIIGIIFITIIIRRISADHAVILIHNPINNMSVVSIYVITKLDKNFYYINLTVYYIHYTNLHSEVVLSYQFTDVVILQYYTFRLFDGVLS